MIWTRTFVCLAARIASAIARVVGGPRRTGRVEEFGGEGLHPAVSRDVIDFDSALGEQLFDVAVARVPARRDRDYLTRKPMTSRSRRT
jgi:hypothetical protein